MRKKFAIGIIIGILAGAVLLALGYYGVSRRAMSNSEKGYLISADVLVPLILPDQTGKSSYLAKRNIDGFLELEYKYESEDVFLKSEAEIFKTVYLAKEGFKRRVQAYSVTFSFQSDVVIAPIVDAVSIGDTNVVAFLQSDNENMGNIVVIRKKHNGSGASAVRQVARCSRDC